jgi:hypothetical protein
MTIAPDATPAERLGQFFDFMWGDVEGVVYLPTKDPSLSPPDDWKRTYYEWPKSKPSVIQHVLTRNAEGKDVFFSPAIYSKSVIPKLRRKEATAKDDILGTNVVWAEYDGNAPDWDSTETFEAASGAPTPAEGPVLGPPTLRVQSSSMRKQHVYWRLKEFTTDILKVEGINRAIAYQTDADKSGWDINQVLRPIETNNHKYTSENVVIVAEETEIEYSLQEFQGFKPPKEYIKKDIDLDRLPPVAEILGKYQWDEDDLDLINKSKEELNDRSAGLLRIAMVSAEMGLPENEIFSMLYYLDEKWEKFKFRNDRVAQLVNQVNKAKQKHPHAVEQPDFAGLTAEKTETAVNEKIVFGFQDILDAEVKIEWLIENFMPVGGLGLIASAPGIGKTQFAMQMAVACALEKPFLEYKPVRRHKTMFFSLEMNLPTTKHFISTMAPAYSGEEIELLQRHMMLLPHGMPINLMLKEGQKGFEYILETYKPEGVYIDSLQKIYLSDLSKDDIRGLFTYLAKIRRDFGVYIIIIHHDRKATEGNKRPRDLSDVYGSQYITAEPDSVVHLWRPSPESKHIELRSLKMRLAPVSDRLIITRASHLQFVTSEQNDQEVKFDGLSKSDDGGPSSPFDPY